MFVRFFLFFSMCNKKWSGNLAIEKFKGVFKKQLITAFLRAKIVRLWGYGEQNNQYGQTEARDALGHFVGWDN